MVKANRGNDKNVPVKVGTKNDIEENKRYDFLTFFLKAINNRIKKITAVSSSIQTLKYNKSALVVKIIFKYRQNTWYKSMIFPPDLPAPKHGWTRQNINGIKNMDSRLRQFFFLFSSDLCSYHSKIKAGKRKIPAILQ